MSAILLKSINGRGTASMTYFQANPNTGIAYSTLISPGGSALGYTSTTSPWSTTASASYNAAAFSATINSDGSISATAPCKIKIRWSSTAYLTSGTAPVNFIIAAITSSSTAPFAQTKGNTVILYNNGTVNLNTNANLIPTICAEFVASKDDSFFPLIAGTNTAMMRQGILEIVTEPLV